MHKTKKAQLLGSIDCNLSFTIKDLSYIQALATNDEFTQEHKIRILSKSVMSLADLYAFIYSAKPTDLENVRIQENIALLKSLKQDIISAYKNIDLGYSFVVENLLNKITK